MVKWFEIIKVNERPRTLAELTSPNPRIDVTEDELREIHEKIKKLHDWIILRIRHLGRPVGRKDEGVLEFYTAMHTLEELKIMFVVIEDE